MEGVSSVRPLLTYYGQRPSLRIRSIYTSRGPRINSNIQSTRAYEHARTTLSVHFSQLPGFRVQQNALVLPDGQTLFDLYRDLQTYTLITSYGYNYGYDNPEASHPPSPYPIIHPVEFRQQSIRLNDVIGIFTVVAMKGPMTLHRDPAFLKYALRTRRAMMRKPWDELSRPQGFIQSGFSAICTLAKDLTEELAAARRRLDVMMVDSKTFARFEDQLKTTIWCIRRFRKAVETSIGHACRLSADVRSEIWVILCRLDARCEQTANQYHTLAASANDAYCKLAVRVKHLEVREDQRQAPPNATDGVALKNSLHLMVLQSVTIVLCVMIVVVVLWKPSSEVSKATVNVVAYDGGDTMAGLLPYSSDYISLILSDLPFPPFSRGHGYKIAELYQ